MPLFRYEAKDQHGQTVVGAMQVADEAVLQRKLTAMGYVPVTVERAPGAAAAPPEGRAAGRDQPVASKHLSLFYEELYTIFRAGITLGQGLSLVAERLPHVGLRAAVADLGRGVEAGAPLGKVLLRYPMMFRNGDRGLLAAGEEGGFLDQSLRLLADRHADDAAVARQVRSVTWYPVLLLFIALFLTFPIISFLKGAFPSGLFQSDMTVPPVVMGLRAMARTLLTVSLPLAAAAVAIVLWVRALANWPTRRRRWHGFLLRVPGLGGLAWARAREQFARALQLLYHGGVPPGAAWAAAAGAISNEELSARVAAQARFVEGGGRFSEAMLRTGVYGAVESGMVATGETAGSIEEMLGKVADSGAAEARTALHRLPIVARVLFFVGAALVTGIAVAMATSAYFSSIFRAFE